MDQYPILSGGPLFGGRTNTIHTNAQYCVFLRQLQPSLLTLRKQKQFLSSRTVWRQEGGRSDRSEQLTAIRIGPFYSLISSSCSGVVLCKVRDGEIHNLGLNRFPAEQILKTYAPGYAGGHISSILLSVF